MQAYRKLTKHLFLTANSFGSTAGTVSQPRHEAKLMMANAQLYDLRRSGPRPSTTMRSPRLLFVDNEVLDFVLHRMVLAQTLLQSGVEVHVAVPDEPGIEVLARKGLCVHVIHLKRKSMNALDEVRCFASLLALYRKVKPDIVHHIRL